MPAIPVFEIGIWNAWIFMLINFLPMPIIMRVHKGLLEDSMKSYGRGHKAVYYIEWILWALSFAYSIFLPLRLDTMWFYVGLPIALVGTVTYIMVIVSFVTTPIGEKPVTTGLYRYSRHPMYITQLVMLIGVGIASASWLFLLLTIAYTCLGLVYAGSEERMCLEKYGDAYRKYTERTPRWIGLPKS
ncbi:MAG: isoprenylcysteine carboxylmethyltransferase family protein [Chloroflexota bacterium]|nr:isoprenylcysteine carboxylmethyltransferase family protein [Chloroflexota bacterium]